jgi:uncharacterized protein
MRGILERQPQRMEARRFPFWKLGGTGRVIRGRSPVVHNQVVRRSFTISIMATSLPAALQRQNYISLTTFRKNGVAVSTPVWFAEEEGKLCVMTNPNSGKCKRIRNNPGVKVAPCTIRGKVTGPEFPATVRILSPAEGERARQAIRAKYWLARVPFLWSKSNQYLEITL